MIEKQFEKRELWSTDKVMRTYTCSIRPENESILKQRGWSEAPQVIVQFIPDVSLDICTIGTSGFGPQVAGQLISQVTWNRLRSHGNPELDSRMDLVYLNFSGCCVSHLFSRRTWVFTSNYCTTSYSSSSGSSSHGAVGQVIQPQLQSELMVEERLQRKNGEADSGYLKKSSGGPSKGERGSFYRGTVDRPGPRWPWVRKAQCLCFIQSLSGACLIRRFVEEMDRVALLILDHFDHWPEASGFTTAIMPSLEPRCRRDPSPRTLHKLGTCDRSGRHVKMGGANGCGRCQLYSRTDSTSYSSRCSLKLTVSF